MIRQVLIVDDDREMLLALREGLARFADTFSVLLAGDGIEALEVLKRQVISVVVTDLKMPRMDGLDLLAAIINGYPDIPVIVITGFSNPEMERLAMQGGAVGFIAKPFLIEGLAKQVISMLHRETEGGRLHNVSTGMFLQLIEMEQKTCTIRVEDKRSGSRGTLFFSRGELLDARVGELQAEDAAYEIFAWDQVSLGIQNDCPVRENRIQKELNPLILEAARRKDEDKKPQPAESRGDAAPAVAVQAADEDAVLRRIRHAIDREFGTRSGVESVFQDPAWNERVKRISRHGERMKLGRLMMGYIDRGDSRDYIVLAGETTTVVAVSPKCPRDKLMQVLSG